MKIKSSNKAKHRFFAEKDICFMQLEYYNLCKYVRSEQMQIIFFNSLFNNEEITSKEKLVYGFMMYVQYIHRKITEYTK